MNEHTGIQLDPAFLRKNFGGDLEVEKIIYETFLIDVIPRWNQIRQLLDNAATGEVRKVVHSSKPSFSFVGLSVLVPEIEHFQKMLEHDPPDIPALSVIYEELQGKLIHVQPQIEEQIRLIEKIQSGMIASGPAASQ